MGRIEEWNVSLNIFLFLRGLYLFRENEIRVFLIRRGEVSDEDRGRRRRK